MTLEKDMLSGETVQNVELNLTALIQGRDDGVTARGKLEPTPDVSKELNINLLEPLTWEIRIQAIQSDASEYFLQGKIAGSVYMACRRCLEEIAVASESNLMYELDYQPTSQRDEGNLRLLEQDDDEDMLVFQAAEVDFTRLLLEIFVAEMPLTALCKPDCKGLAEDGVNLNHFPDHQPEKEVKTVDSPFAALQDLKISE